MNRYPFLSDWKRNGFREFPGFPIEWLLESPENIETTETIDANIEKQWIVLIHEARTRIVVRGENRGRVGRDLVNKLFPKTKGGPGFTKNQAIILKNIHGELQELIKEFRRKLDIPLIKTKTSTFPEMIDSEEVHEYFPEINTLLDSHGTGWEYTIGNFPKGLG